MSDAEIQYVLDNVTTNYDYAALECLDLIEVRLVGSDATSATASSFRNARLQGIAAYRQRLRIKMAARVSPFNPAESVQREPAFRTGAFDSLAQDQEECP